MKIILRARKKKETVGETVRINEAAQNTLSEIMRETGLSATYIVSQIIVQIADYVELIEEE